MTNIGYELYNGKGILYASDGKIYKSGTWNMGRLIVADNTETNLGFIKNIDDTGKVYFYYGDTKNADCHDNGKLITGFGDIYIGEFADGFYTMGLYIATDTNGGWMYAGAFKKQKRMDMEGFISIILLTLTNLCILTNIKEGCRNGWGIMYYANGSVYESEWKNGEPIL